MDDAAGNRPGEARRRVIEKSMTDEEFRERLLTDPRRTVEQELGAPLPEGVELRVVEETPETIYLVLPPKGSVGGEGDLSDRDLEAVAGGGLGTDGTYTCGGASTCYYVDTVCST